VTGNSQYSFLLKSSGFNFWHTVWVIFMPPGHPGQHANGFWRSWLASDLELRLSRVVPHQICSCNGHQSQKKRPIWRVGSNLTLQEPNCAICIADEAVLSGAVPQHNRQDFCEASNSTPDIFDADAVRSWDFTEAYSWRVFENVVTHSKGGDPAVSSLTHRLSESLFVRPCPQSMGSQTPPKALGRS